MKFTVRTDAAENLRMILDICDRDAVELGNALLDAAAQTQDDNTMTVIYRSVDRKNSGIRPVNRFFAIKPITNDDSEYGSMPVRVFPSYGT